MAGGIIIRASRGSGVSRAVRSPLSGRFGVFVFVIAYLCICNYICVFVENKGK